MRPRAIDAQHAAHIDRLIGDITNPSNFVLAVSKSVSGEWKSVQALRWQLKENGWKNSPSPQAVIEALCILRRNGLVERQRTRRTKHMWRAKI
jgi:hypothetical protein